jgi:hypothetical protein
MSSCISSWDAYLVCSVGSHCIYRVSDFPDEALEDSSSSKPPTPSQIKASIIAIFSSSNPRDIIMSYTETIHPWFSIFSHSTLSGDHPTAWDDTSVEFDLLCFAITILNFTPQELDGACIIRPEHRSMYLQSKSWIALLDAAGINSIDFVKAKLLINLYELSHGLYPAAYLSIAATVRAADALSAFQPPGVSHSFSEIVRDEYRIMWCGIAVVDRFAAQTICSKSAIH